MEENKKFTKKNLSSKKTQGEYVTKEFLNLKDRMLHIITCWSVPGKPDSLNRISCLHKDLPQNVYQLTDSKQSLLHFHCSYL